MIPRRHRTKIHNRPRERERDKEQSVRPVNADVAEEEGAPSSSAARQSISAQVGTTFKTPSIMKATCLAANKRGKINNRCRSLTTLKRTKEEKKKKKKALLRRLQTAHRQTTEKTRAGERTKSRTPTDGTSYSRRKTTPAARTSILNCRFLPLCFSFVPLQRRRTTTMTTTSPSWAICYIKQTPLYLIFFPPSSFALSFSDDVALSISTNGSIGKIARGSRA